MAAERVKLHTYRRLSPEGMRERSVSFRDLMQRRRSVRQFSGEPVERRVIEDSLLTAGSAPSGANCQPWHFVVVTDGAMKRRIREAAEKEEYEFYQGRAGEEWLEALSPLGTDHHKPFLEEAPYLVVVFAQKYGASPDGERVGHYYVQESVGMATGLLVAAVHNAGLACLTYTPSRMGFLREMLGRPQGERPFCVLVVGYPADGATVPEVQRKTLDQIATFE